MKWPDSRDLGEKIRWEFEMCGGEGEESVGMSPKLFVCILDISWDKESWKKRSILGEGDIRVYLGYVKFEAPLRHHGGDTL